MAESPDAGSLPAADAPASATEESSSPDPAQEESPPEGLEAFYFR